MKRIVEVPLDQHGGFVVAEIDEDEVGWSRTAIDIDQVTKRAGGSVEEALKTTIRPLAAAMINGFVALKPETVELEFGLRLSGKFGAIVASSEAEGHLQVKLTWRPHVAPGPKQSVE